MHEAGTHFRFFRQDRFFQQSPHFSEIRLDSALETCDGWMYRRVAFQYPEQGWDESGGPHEAGSQPEFFRACPGASLTGVARS